MFYIFLANFNLSQYSLMPVEYKLPFSLDIPKPNQKHVHVDTWQISTYTLPRTLCGCNVTHHKRTRELCLRRRVEVSLKLSFFWDTLYCNCERTKCHNDTILDIVNHVTVALRRSVTQNHEHQVWTSPSCFALIMSSSIAKPNQTKHFWMCVGHKLVPADPLELFIAVKVVLNLMKVTYFNLPNMGHFFRDTLYKLHYLYKLYS